MGTATASPTSSDFFAPAWSFGGVQADQVIALITILCTVTLFFSALGVFFGAILKGALQASLFAQGAALFAVEFAAAAWS